MIIYVNIFIIVAFFLLDFHKSEYQNNLSAKGIIFIWNLINSWQLVYSLPLFIFVSVPPRYDPVFRLSPPPSSNTFPCLIDPSEGAFEAFDIKPK